MKVNIGKHATWVGPYQLAEKILFWKDRNSKAVENLGKFLAYGSTKYEPRIGDDVDPKQTWLYNFLEWIYENKKRKVTVRIDPWDTWNADETLAIIILPLLKQYKNRHDGGPCVDDSDVPEGMGLRASEAPPKESEWDVDENHFKRWEWVLDEIIWAFEQLQPDCDWDSQYQSGTIDYISEPTENGCYRLTHGPNHTAKFDSEGYKAHKDRIQNGLRLFGKFYCSLWD